MSENQSSNEWSVLRMLEWATDYLESKQVPSPRLSIEWLLAHVLGCKRLDLYLAFDRPLTVEELGLIKPLILRRAKHEPLQYITGSTNFYGLEIAVSEAVLIPRPETEELVETVLKDYPATSDERSVIDLGTGSGCIPLAIKSERPNWNVSGLDISSEALSLAKNNATSLELDVHFFQHDFFLAKPKAIQTKVDIITSNPPYIPEADRESIDKEVRDFEPAIALFHADVMKVYDAVIKFAEMNLKKGGHLYMEIHEDLGPQILSLLPKNKWKKDLKKDYNTRDRIISGLLI